MRKTSRFNPANEDGVADSSVPDCKPSEVAVSSIGMARPSDIRCRSERSSSFDHRLACLWLSQCAQQQWQSQRHARLVIFLATMFVCAATLVGQEPSKDDPPALSLESLYHPDKKHDHDGELPAVHWVDDNPPRLLMRREKAWLQVDLATGRATPWPTFGRIADQLRGLKGLSEDQANSAALDVVIEVNGGPQNPSVANRWSGTKSLYRELLARRGIATLIVDNRSSAGRGMLDTWTIRGRVGEVEFKDLQTAVSWLKQQDWVDPDRLTVRGWSFGGFSTLYAMTHCQDFRAGIAGGSVTDWREYDAFYTERYMGLPSENPDGDRLTAPVESVAKMHGRVLLIHGEMDDNVHPTGTLRMADSLQRAGKDFELMIYPGAGSGDPRTTPGLALGQADRPISGRPVEGTAGCEWALN